MKVLFKNVSFNSSAQRKVLYNKQLPATANRPQCKVRGTKYMAKVKQFASAIHRSSHHRSTEGTAEIVDFLFRCIPLIHNQDATPLRGVIDLTKVQQAHNKQTKLKQAKSNERTQSHRVQPYSVLSGFALKTKTYCC